MNDYDDFLDECRGASERPQCCTITTGGVSVYPYAQSDEHQLTFPVQLGISLICHDVSGGGGVL